MNSESMLKGRMAETLFEEMMRQCGNIVYRFGYEAIIQNLAQLDANFVRYGEVGERIRSIPDFIVISNTGKPLFVEVKFRWKPELHRDDYEKIQKIQKFWNATMVFVNCWEQPYFRVSEPPYFNKNLQLLLKPLASETEWKVDKKIYDEYEELVHKYLTPTLVPTKR